MHLIDDPKLQAPCPLTNSFFNQKEYENMKNKNNSKIAKLCFSKSYILDHFESIDIEK